MEEEKTTERIVAIDKSGRIYIQQITTYPEMPGFTSQRYEIWADREHYENQIYQDDNECIYCRGIASSRSIEKFLNQYYE